MQKRLPKLCWICSTGNTNFGKHTLTLLSAIGILLTSLSWSLSKPFQPFPAIRVLFAFCFNFFLFHGFLQLTASWYGDLAYYLKMYAKYVLRPDLTGALGDASGSFSSWSAPNETQIKVIHFYFKQIRNFLVSNFYIDDRLKYQTGISRNCLPKQSQWTDNKVWWTLPLPITHGLFHGWSEHVTLSYFRLK